MQSCKISGQKSTSFSRLCKANQCLTIVISKFGQYVYESWHDSAESADFFFRSLGQHNKYKFEVLNVSVLPILLMITEYNEIRNL
jgi:hypothetical protein